MKQLLWATLLLWATPSNARCYDFAAEDVFQPAFMWRIISAFWLFAIGYSVAFGGDCDAFSGGFSIMTSQFSSHSFQQTFFCATCCTIVSGALAERAAIVGFAINVFFMSTFTYPVVAHWAWSPEGWLYKKGFQDIAGSAVVHIVGGATGLVGTKLLGPRFRRFIRNSHSNKWETVLKYNPNYSMISVGTLILWVCWFIFNSGSIRVAPPPIMASNFSAVNLDAADFVRITASSPNSPQILVAAVNTMLGACGGGIAGAALSKLITGEIEVQYVLNSILTGLVSITAGCVMIEPVYFSLLIGAAGSLVCVGVSRLLRAYAIDDPVDAVAVHFGGGVWGTLAVGFFGDNGLLGKSGSSKQLATQVLGCVAISAWAITCAFFVFFLVKLSQKATGKRLFRRDFYEETKGLESAFAKREDVVSQVLAQNHLRARATPRESQSNSFTPNKPAVTIHTGLAEVKEDQETVNDAASDQQESNDMTGLFQTTSMLLKKKRAQSSSSAHNRNKDFKFFVLLKIWLKALDPEYERHADTIYNAGYFTRSAIEQLKMEDLLILEIPMSDARYIVNMSSRDTFPDTAEVQLNQTTLTVQTKREDRVVKTSGYGNGEALQVQICSDLHIEMWHRSSISSKAQLMQNTIVPSAPVLVLCGGQGVCGTPEGLVEYQRFLEYHSARFELILVVAGTHEFFNIRDASGDNSKEPVSVAEISARIEQVCSQISGVYFLNDSSVIVNDVQFSGCTLWSEIPSEYSSAVEAVLNEFQMIYTEADDGTKRLITAQDTTRWHRKSAEFLTTSARQAKAQGRRMFVVTHHPPTLNGTCSKKYVNSPMACALGGSLDRFFNPDDNEETSAIQTWAFGKTHWSCDQELGGVRIVSNQYGYRCLIEDENTGHISAKVIGV